MNRLWNRLPIVAPYVRTDVQAGTGSVVGGCARLSWNFHTAVVQAAAGAVSGRTLRTRYTSDAAHQR